jgi:imidazole glycerol-phosphate synthase subunit HisH
MMKKILILDIKNGNLNSLYNIVRKKITKNVTVSGSKRDIQSATHIIFPGVGAYSEVMRKLNKNICVKTLENNILNKKKPFLGICVGMQVLFSESNEFKNSKGLNWIKGRITNLKKPSIGWAKIKNLQKNKVFKKNLFSKEFYFLHNFYIKKNKYSVATLKSNITAIVNKDNIYGTQFHPENSHKQGVELLKNFIKI